MAYTEFAGKQLPTIYHWQKAASPAYFAAIVELSNFGGAGPARVGSHKGMSAFGTLDMAGNVKEWGWNEFGGERFILAAHGMSRCTCFRTGCSPSLGSLHRKDPLRAR